MKPSPAEALVSLYQSLSPAQLSALKRGDWRAIPAGDDAQSICLLKLRQRYAEMVARQWLLPLYGRAYVVRLELPASALATFELGSVAYAEHLEYRVPAAHLPRLAIRLQSPVRVVSAFRPQHSYSLPAGGGPLLALMG